ncbi:MAG: TdeIII family type II restriction endonuclease [Chloroflexota bacterium]
MGLSIQQYAEIKDLLSQKIKHKLTQYRPESNSMPFQFRLLGKDRMALFSFIQSINTMLGASIFEQVACIIALPHFKRVERQYTGFSGKISEQAQYLIQEIMDDLIANRIESNKSMETAKILAVAQQGKMKQVKIPTIDLFLISFENSEFYFDLKTAKPNKGDFEKFKRQLLEWVALRGVETSTVDIKTLLAIPYNPYEPEPYERWTNRGVFDWENELMVADKFWDFLGGENTYVDLLRVFEDVGITLRPEIDARFAKF